MVPQASGSRGRQLSWKSGGGGGGGPVMGGRRYHGDFRSSHFLPSGAGSHQGPEAGYMRAGRALHRELGSGASRAEV